MEKLLLFSNIFSLSPRHDESFFFFPLIASDSLIGEQREIESEIERETNAIEDKAFDNQFDRSEDEFSCQTRREKEREFFSISSHWKKGESRKTISCSSISYRPFRVSAGERLVGRVSWQSKEDKSAHGTRVNESKRARLPNPKPLLNLLPTE